MKQIKGYDISSIGSPSQIPNAPIRALVATALGFTAKAYVEVSLDDSGEPVTAEMMLVQLLPAEQGIADTWTWLAATLDGRYHLFEVTDADTTA